ncbi:phage recombination protein Bet [uncultured Pseudodesulfovibrio sp.]|uniref:phage recombination protein Bet n=1 Tax=uncultured Pseudodesulfovibrio sp. TaxID=2035858 RepID=UPI0029C75655|nr:phage recombination protein Bet [uncultured Pseudodesulfovibrio sp.]
MTANQSLVPSNGNGSKGALIAKFATKFGVDQGQLTSILKATCFKLPSKRNEPPAEVSNEQMAALLIVADQYGLNPFTKEIYAFPDKGKGIVPIVGVDGWTRIMNEHPEYDGLEFNYSEDIVQVDDDAKPCPSWIEVVIYRKDRTRPIKVREYLAECYRPAFKGQYGKIEGPWQTHTSRFLRHKALIQGARIAFGFSGIYEDDEAERIANARVVNMNQDMPAAIDAEPVRQEQPQTIRRPVQQPEDPEAAFFGDSAPQYEAPAEQQEQPAEGQGANINPTDEIAVAEFVLSGEDLEAYKVASAAEKKKKCLSYLQSFGAQQADAERLVGKGYGQWTTRDRAALLGAYSQLASGSDPADVFPTA